MDEIREEVIRLLDAFSVSKDDLEVFEELCWIADESGVMDFRVVRPESELLFQLVLLAQSYGTRERIPKNIRP